MTTHAQEPVDPLARIGRQIVAAAELRGRRRRRRRTLLTFSAATLALGGAVGVAAVDMDVIGPTPTLLSPFAQHGTDRVDLQLTQDLDEPWTVAVYRTVGAGLCIGIAPSTRRASPVQCGAAVVTAQELGDSPVTSTAGTVVQRRAGEEVVLVSGLARPDVERLRLEGAGGASAEATLDGATLRVPTTAPGSGEPSNDLTIRPFAVLVPEVPVGVKRLRLVAHTHAGDVLVREVHVDPAVAP